MWGALASAAASIVGSLFGGDKEDTTTTSYVDYKRMVRMAEAAGFNPLTAIRNGGSAGFSVGTTSGGGTPLSSRIASGLAGGVETFLNNFDPMKDQKRELEYSILERQLANLSAGVTPRPGFGGVPAVTAGPVSRPPIGSRTAHGAPAGSLASAVPEKPAPSRMADEKVIGDRGSSQPTEIQRPEVTNPYPKAWNMSVDPDVPNASAWEDRNGDSELNSMIAGAVVTSHDVAYTMKKRGFWDALPYPSTGAEKAQADQYTAALSRRRKKAAMAEAAARRAGFVPYPTGLQPYMGPRL